MSKSLLLAVVDHMWQMDCLGVCAGMISSSYTFLCLGTRCFNQPGRLGFTTRLRKLVLSMILEKLLGPRALLQWTLETYVYCVVCLCSRHALGFEMLIFRSFLTKGLKRDNCL